MMVLMTTVGGLAGVLAGLGVSWVWLEMWCLEIGCARPTWSPFGPEEFCSRHRDASERKLP